MVDPDITALNHIGYGDDLQLDIESDKNDFTEDLLMIIADKNGADTVL